MRQKIKCYDITWVPRKDYFICGGMAIGDHSLDTFSKILLNDYDKHPLLEKVKIKFKDKHDLSGFARLLMYFNENYQQLFVETRLYLPHFQAIEIEFDEILISKYNRGSKGPELERYEPQNSHKYSNRELIFAQNANEDYPIEEKVIEIKNIKQGIEHFGIIYQNVFKWLRSIQAQSNGYAATAISGYKIAFL